MDLTCITRKELMPGVCLTAVHTNKFKSSHLGVTLLTGLERETAAANALIPWVLRRGSQEHPDMQSISAALDDLYGGAPYLCRQALHAASLSFLHPNGTDMTVNCDLPQDMSIILDKELP